MHIHKAGMKFVFGSILLGLAVTLGSAVRRSELDLSDYMLPCVMQIFTVPVRLTDYGFPIYWLSSTEFVRQYGCGSIVGHFVTYSLLLPGFLVDVILYAAFCGMLLHLGGRLLQRFAKQRALFRIS